MKIFDHKLFKNISEHQHYSYSLRRSGVLYKHVFLKMKEAIKYKPGCYSMNYHEYSLQFNIRGEEEGEIVDVAPTEAELK